MRTLLLIFILFTINPWGAHQTFAQNTLDVLGLSSSSPASAAYALRRLSTSYSGNLIQVRRSSDNTTTNVGYDGNGVLDTASLKTFVGSGNGFVTKFYDQSGNGLDASQGTAAAQPRIVNAGVVDRQNGWPSIYFNGSNNLATASFTALSAGFTSIVVGGVSSNTTYPTFVNKSSSNIANPIDVYSSNYFVGNGTTYSNRTLTTAINSSAGFTQWSFAGDATQMQAWQQGVNNISSNSAPLAYADANVPLILGTRNDGATSLNGYISESIVFPAVLSNANRTLVECNEMNFYRTSPITGGSSVCINGSVGLSDALSGGTWSSSVPSVATIGSTTGICSGTSLGSSVISYTLASGCVLSESFTVNGPAISAGTSVAICSGASATLTATGATTYNWAPSTALSSTTAASPVANPTVTTTYTVTGTASGCSNTASVTVTVNPNPSITGSPSFAVCSGIAAPLTASGASTYSWSPSATLSASTGAAISATPTVTTTYTVVGTSAAGCTGQRTVTVTINPIPVIGGGVGGTICSGSSVALTATGGVTYSWIPATGLSATTGATVTASPTVTSTYTVTGTDASNCSNTAIASVLVSSLPTVNSVTGNTACTSAATSVSATNSSGSFLKWYSLITGGSVVGYGSPMSIASAPVSNTDYFAEANTLTGSATLSTLFSGSATLQTMGFNVGVTNPIAINSANVRVGSGATSVSIYYRTGGVSQSNINNSSGWILWGSVAVNPALTPGTVTVTFPSPLILTPGTYALAFYSSAGVGYTFVSGGGIGTVYSSNSDITLTKGVGTSSLLSGTVVSPETINCSITYSSSIGCTSTPRVKATLTVNAMPTVTASSSVAVCAGASASLSVSGTAVSYSWAPAAGLSATTGASVNATPASTTTYTVTGTNASGCTKTSTVTVTVNALPSISGGSNVAICTGQNTILTATGGNSYTWSPATGLSSTTGSGVTAAPTVTVIYTVTGTDAHSCASTGTVTVTVNPLPVISAGTDRAICLASNTLLSGSGGVSYTWAPSIGLSATTGASVTASPSVTTVYTVTGTNANSCSNTAPVTVTVNPLPVVGAGSNVAICNGQATPLTATGAVTYSWSPAAGLSATSGAAVTASPTVTTVYSVSGTAATTCVNTASVTISVNPLPAINAGSSIAICQGQSTTLTATGGVTYSWSPATGLSASTGTSVSASPTVTTTYTVTGVNASGCINISTVTVTVNSLPSLSLSSDVAICSGNSTALSAAGAATYSWSPSAGLSASTGASVSASPTGSTSYTVTGTSVAGCAATAAVTVTVNATPVVDAGSGLSICAGSGALLAASGAVTYSWSPSATLSASTGASVTATPAVNTTYSVTGTSLAGCAAGTTVTVTVNALPSIASGGAASTCAGVSSSLTASGGATYFWSPATGLSASTGAAVTATPSSTTTYTVTGTDANGCVNTSTVAVTINALPAVGAGAGTAVCQGASASLTATGAVTYSWSPSTGLSATTGSSVTSLVSGTTTYTITGVGSNGCTNTGAVTVTVNPLPSVSAITGSTGVCIGSTTTLSNATSGGVWSSGSALATVGAVSGIVTGVAMGTVTISYTFTDGNGCVAVTSTPVVVAGTPKYLYTLCGLGTNVTSGDNGPANLASIQGPRSVATDTSGNLYIADVTANVIRKIGTNGYITRVAGNGTAGSSGNGGPATAAQLSMSGGGCVNVDRAGNIYICNTSGNTIQKVTASTGIINVIAGTGVSGFTGDGGAATAAKIYNPFGICIDAAGNIYFSDQLNYRIRKITPSGVISTIIGTGSNASSGDGGPGTAARVSQPRDLVLDNSGNLYIVDGNNYIRKYIIATGIISTIAGTGTGGYSGDGGPATAAMLNRPARAAFDGGRMLYVSDQDNNRIRQINLTTGIIRTVVATGTASYTGDGGPSVSGTLWSPAGIAVGKRGEVYIADANNRRVRIAPFNESIVISIPNSSLASGAPAVFTAKTSINTSYTTLQWQVNGTNVGTGGFTYTNSSPSTGDVYRCILTTAPECGTAFSDTSNSITVTVAGSKTGENLPTSLSAVSLGEGMSIYPNPVHGLLNLEASGLQSGDAQIQVIDQLGRTVLSQTISLSDTVMLHQIDMSTLPSGMYLITVTDAGAKKWMLKFIKS